MNTFRNSNEKFQGATIAYHGASDDILYRTYNDGDAEYLDPISCDEVFDLVQKGLLLIATTSHDEVYTPIYTYLVDDDPDAPYAAVVYISGISEEAPVMGTAYSKEYPGA